MKRLIAFFSTIIAAITLIVAISFFFSKEGGGFFVGLGTAFALLSLGMGNLVVFALNALYWRLYGLPWWLRSIVILQALPAVVFFVGIGRTLYDQVLDSRAYFQRTQIMRAIEADDSELLLSAQVECAQACTARYSLNEQLLDAADEGSLRVAAQLVDGSARVASKLGEPSRDMRTCEGLFLPLNDALSFAVARDNEAMARLLLPVSDEGSRRKALWLSAQLDRMNMLQLLVQAGVPLDIRGAVLDENNTLLVAAASGAALQVGRWLIESAHMPVNAIQNGPDPFHGLAPLAALFSFASEVGSSPRTSPFLNLLVEHGAAIDAPILSGVTMLQEAVRTEQKGQATLLLNAGANPGLLDVSTRKTLNALLNTNTPDEPVDTGDRTIAGCIRAASST
ncbi:hypothetical protein [Pseudomonas yamanorum]